MKPGLPDELDRAFIEFGEDSDLGKLRAAVKVCVAAAKLRARTAEEAFLDAQARYSSAQSDLGEADDSLRRILEALEDWQRVNRQQIYLPSFGSFGQETMEFIAAAAPIAAAGTAIAREAIRQRGETRREELRQNGETTRTALTGTLPEVRAIELPGDGADACDMTRP